MYIVKFIYKNKTYKKFHYYKSQDAISCMKLAVNKRFELYDNIQLIYLTENEKEILIIETRVE